MVLSRVSNFIYFHGTYIGYWTQNRENSPIFDCSWSNRIHLTEQSTDCSLRANFFWVTILYKHIQYPCLILGNSFQSASFDKLRRIRHHPNRIYVQGTNLISLAWLWLHLTVGDCMRSVMQTHWSSGSGSTRQKRATAKSKGNKSGWGLGLSLLIGFDSGY